MVRRSAYARIAEVADMYPAGLIAVSRRSSAVGGPFRIYRCSIRLKRDTMQIYGKKTGYFLGICSYKTYGRSNRAVF